MAVLSRFCGAIASVHFLTFILEISFNDQEANIITRLIEIANSIGFPEHPAMNKSYKILAAAVLLVATPSASLAEITSSVVDSWVGLESPFRISCSDVNFGVWFVPVGDRGGPTTITLFITSETSNTGVSISGTDSGRLAVIKEQGYKAPLAGVCDVDGSLAANGDELTIGFENDSNTDMSLEPSLHKYAEGLSAAPISASLSVSLSAPEKANITEGEATFRVVGALTIPQSIVRDNYGAYKASQPAFLWP